MYKCKNCGTDFDSKFCPNCGEAAPEAENDSKGVYVESDLETTIRRKGIPNIWKRDCDIDKVICAVWSIIFLCVEIAIIILFEKIYDKFDYFSDLAPLDALLAFDKYKSEIDTLFIYLIVFGIIHYCILYSGLLLLDYSKIKWIKTQNINAAYVITGGPLKDKHGDVDRKAFLETKLLLYKANRSGAMKWGVIMTLVEIAVNIISDIIVFKILYYLITTFSEYSLGRLVYMEMPIQLAALVYILFVVVAIILPSVIVFAIKKVSTNKKEYEIDEWAKAQVKADKLAQSNEENKTV